MSGEKAIELFADRPLMTLRVSHDSGRTWRPERAVYTTDGLRPLITTEWPPCQCRRCSRPSDPSHS